MNKLIILCLLLSFASCKNTTPKKVEKEEQVTSQIKKTTIETDTYRLHYYPIDKFQAEQIKYWLNEGQQTINAFFGKGIEQKFNVHIFSKRDSLDKQWQHDWGMPDFNSQCWMVASGVAHRLDILSPRVWKDEACEHDIEDTLATKRLIIHELVHVFHGQNNPSPTFDNIENIDWFVEGLAVYVSGQLDDGRYNRAKASILKDESPDQLQNIWKGANKYGYAGSITKLVDDKYGRSTFKSLLNMTTATQILKALESSEEELIQEWKMSFRNN